MMTLIDPLRVLIFVSVQLLIAVSNALLMRRLARFPKAEVRPRVSVLVPARDEEETVGACIASLLGQDYPDFEVVVLDDGSSDRTPEVLAAIRDPRLRVVAGEPLPEGWTGKAWACQQLAGAATGELLLFTDADTRHEPQALSRAVNAREATRADLLTGITGNEVRSFGELVTVPFPTWSIFTLLPLGLAYLLRRSTAFSAANGKFLLIRQETYREIGGHAALRGNAVEDIELGKRVKRAGFRWRMLDASRDVSARMYAGFREAVPGFTKNYFALFGYRLLVALFVWCWLLTITFYPAVMLVRAGLGRTGPTDAVFSGLAVLVTGMSWLLLALKFGFPVHLALVYPAVIAAATYIGLRSLVLTTAGRTVWKGRRLARHRVRLL